MPTEIVAELAQGFEGRPEVARLLVLAAARAGADAAKFQLVYADELATPDYVHYQLFRSLELPYEEWERVSLLGADEGIQVWFDVFGEQSLALAERLGAGAVKLHGSDTANEGMLVRVASSTVPRIVLGAGGADLDEIEVALRLLGRKQVVLMLGFQAYPTAEADNQVARVRALAERFRGRGGLEIGFADHADTAFPSAALPAAVAIGAGASMIEKHLTLGRAVRLEDHESALGPDEFADFCSAVRSCDAIFGQFGPGNDMGMSAAERAYRLKIRRHVIASRDLPSGHVVSAADVMLRRTGCETAIRDIRDAYGRTLGVAVARHAAITPDSFGDAP